MWGRLALGGDYGVATRPSRLGVNYAESMDTPQATLTTAPAPDSPESDAATTDLVEDELLVEEISIDGMCGVY